MDSGGSKWSKIGRRDPADGNHRHRRKPHVISHAVNTETAGCPGLGGSLSELHADLVDGSGGKGEKGVEISLGGGGEAEDGVIADESADGLDRKIGLANMDAIDDCAEVTGREEHIDAIIDDEERRTRRSGDLFGTLSDEIEDGSCISVLPAHLNHRYAGVDGGADVSGSGVDRVSSGHGDRLVRIGDEVDAAYVGGA